MADFHFLRPAWFLALLALAGLAWLHRKRRARADAMGGMIAPHLLAHLTVGKQGNRRVGPGRLVATVAVVMTTALAGPTWEREPPPFADDVAALVIAIDASPSMNCIDVGPTRLERAKHKVRDLLALRPGARTGLIAYAGTAHMVLPLTDDNSILETYLDAIDPALMPEKGKRPDRAIAEARTLLERQEASGSILLLTDAVPQDARDGFTGKELILAIGTARGGPTRTAKGIDANHVAPPLDEAGIEASGARVTRLTADQADVNEILGRAERSIIDVRSDDAGTRWKDNGYYLVFPCLLLAAFWFRRGWIVRWAPALLPLILLTGCSADAWWTPDQQAQRLFDAGEFADAAERFEDPMWQGVAWFRGGEFERAVSSFGLAGAHFNRGTALFMLGRYNDAIEAYDAALALDPRDEDARFNRALAIQQRDKLDVDKGEAGQGTEIGADEIRFDKKKKDGGQDTVVEGMKSKQMADVWMRQVQTTPADFLRIKFRFQAAKEKQ